MPLKIAIIGAGLIGPRHAQSVISNPSTDLVALIDPSPSAAAIAAQLQTNYYPSIAAMLSSSSMSMKPDAAIVCTPTHTHVTICKELLSANMHILVEKPIADTLDSGLSLLHHLLRPEHAHLKLLVGHHRRFNRYVRKTKSLLSTGSLGRLIAINGLWTLYKPPEYFAPPTSWRRDSATAGGVLAINLIHDIDVLQFLLDAAVVRVHAEKTPTVRPRPPHAAEEGAAMTLRFANGVVATFLVCDATPAPYSFEMGTGENPRIPPRREPGFYRFFGAEASLSVPDMIRWSYDGSPAKSWTEPLTREMVDVDVEEVTPFDAQLAHFVDVVNGTAEPSCSAQDGLSALMVCEAVRRALETGETVEVDVDRLNV